VGRIGRNALQGKPHHPLNLRISDLTRRPGPRLIEQTIQTAFHKALSPFADCLWCYPEFARNQHVGITSRALQHNSRPLSQCLRTRGPSRPVLQVLALFNRQTSVSPSASASFFHMADACELQFIQHFKDSGH
jgi:hypothetical protein